MFRNLAIALCVLVPSMGSAASVFLNGVNIDGVANQTFQNCSVQIDANGNIFITAKGYAVGGSTATAQPAPAPNKVVPAPEPTMNQHYWLVTEKAAPGMSQFDIELFVNGKFVRKFLDDEEHVVLEITKFLQPGQNKLTFLAKKNLGTARRSSSPQHYFRVVVGEGESGGRNVMITKKLIDYKRTALETKDFKDDFVITTR